MNQENLKQAAAEAALSYIKPGMVLGVGSGSTVNYFIDALKKVKSKIDSVVASSNATAARIKALSIPVIDLNTVSELPLYIDYCNDK